MKKLILLFFLISLNPVEAMACGVLHEKFGPDLPCGLQKKLLSSFEWLKKVKLVKTSPLHQSFFGSGQTGQVYLDFVFRADQFTYKMLDSNSSTVARVYGGRPIVETTQNLFARQEHFIDDLSFLIHEARHIQVGEGRFGHVRCPEGALDGRAIVGHVSGVDLVGSKACDLSPRGAYAHQIVMLSNISKNCSTCTADERKRAAFVAEQLLQRIVSPAAKSQLLGDIHPD